MSKIIKLRARQILDSRGNPTVEAELISEKACITASVPSGESTGKHEAFELRDNEKAYYGKGVLKAVKNVNTVIAKNCKGMLVEEQAKLDTKLTSLDGTRNKRRLGANAILSVSMASCRAAAQETHTLLAEYVKELYQAKKLTLPCPIFNLIEGGKHAGNKLSMQEYWLMPTGAKNFSEALRIGSEVYHELGSILEKRFGKNALNVGLEGGYAPQYQCAEEPMDAILEAVQNLGYWKKIKLGLDSAATSFWNGKSYLFEEKEITSEQLKQRYIDIAKSYPLLAIEDAFHEEDFLGFSLLQKKLKKLMIIGDDLTVTNVDRIKKALEYKSCNSLLVKINQVGTITETLKACKLARNNKWKLIVSHRSGETSDDFIADLAVGISAGFIKAGAPCRGERLAKYNRLLRLEEWLGKKARYVKI